MMHGYGFGMWGIGILGMIIFWGIAIAVLAWVVRSIASSKQERKEPTAIHILESRYAMGEINKKQFTSMKATLSE